ncbi:MAG: collagen-like protein, partial [Myxococcales bacterium]|nr:collagen-like protein [Myxococcales bacterium]
MSLRLLPIVLAAACVAESSLQDLSLGDTSDTGTSGDSGSPGDTGDTGDSGPVGDSGDSGTPGDSGSPTTDPRLDDAVLVVVEPQPGQVYALGDGIPLEARVEAEDGTKLAVDDITWTLGRDTVQGAEGSFDVDGGTYTVRV